MILSHPIYGPLRVLGFVAGSTSVVSVRFTDCGHLYRELEDQVESLLRRGCVQCRVAERVPTRRSASNRHSTARRSPGQAAKLIEDHR